MLEVASPARNRRRSHRSAAEASTIALRWAALERLPGDGVEHRG
jgi:hypothetical protein